MREYVANKGMALFKLIALGVLCILVVGVAVGAWGYHRDRAHARAARTALAGLRQPDPPRFDASMIADLPEIAQRYFTRAIEPGTPLHRVVSLEMEGTFTLNGTPMPMAASQILAPVTRGFVWEASIGQGFMRFSGSDGYVALDGPVNSWTRFWLHGLIPLARVGGTPDHARDAAARAMLETIWVPASLLPQHGARWVQTGPDSAEIRFADLPDEGPMQITLDPQGDVASVQAMRWSDANPARTYRLQPFGGQMLESRQIAGFRIPVRVVLGNHFGTDDYAPFFEATVTSATY
ncbi:MAG: hypothetical protein HLUCCA12_12875 [Rhodobacteraceae bacterium HLUCCA12]|nr:MAG: hypothetical protein HLUCCA12_12875 [Rhodobacteraceae bacterium HLUCCA12]